MTFRSFRRCGRESRCRFARSGDEAIDYSQASCQFEMLARSPSDRRLTASDRLNVAVGGRPSTKTQRIIICCRLGLGSAKGDNKGSVTSCNCDAPALGNLLDDAARIPAIAERLVHGGFAARLPPTKAPRTILRVVRVGRPGAGIAAVRGWHLVGVGAARLPHYTNCNHAQHKTANDHPHNAPPQIFSSCPAFPRCRLERRKR